jgi:hypothetical protein
MPNSTDDGEGMDGSGGGFLSTSIQDRVLSKMLQSIIPSDYPIEEYASMKDKRKDHSRPPFSVSHTTNNFRRFNARVGIVFIFQHRVYRLLQWEDPVHTLSLLTLYTFICLNPYLLAALPFAATLLFVMVPSFIIRHPPPQPQPNLSNAYTAHGPATAPPPEIRAVSEISKDLFRNLRDLQNTMDDFSTVYDYLIATFGPPTSFSDEKISSAVFLFLFFTSCTLLVTAYLLPWRLILLLGGWFVFAAGHPEIQSMMLAAYETSIRSKERQVTELADSFIRCDITLSTTQEMREVEVFELQRRTGSSGGFESWMFSPSPYEPLSPQRIAEEKPRGTRFFEDVRAPPGWDWSDSKWTLDIASLTWVGERCIDGVEVEEEGERWVYDNECGVYDGRGMWRRRRWVRNVQRRYIVE